MALIRQDRGAWEKEYQDGSWEFLSDENESIRYTVLARYIAKQQRPIRLCDVGCGPGIILRHLDMNLIAKYTGLDFVQESLDRIDPKRSQDRYICSSLEEYVPDDKWDVILFNEVLYYMDDPVKEMRKFEAALSKGGIFIVSMHKKDRWLAYGDRCIRRVRSYFKEAHYDIQDAVELKRIYDHVSWTIYVVRPPFRSS